MSARWARLLVVMLTFAACGPGGVTETTTSPTTLTDETQVQDIWEIEAFAPWSRGPYFIDPDLDPSTPHRVIYEVPEGWSMWIGGTKPSVSGHVGVSITTVTNLVSDGYVEEFGFLDVQGSRLMIAAERSAGTPQQDLEELRSILDSIRIEP